MAYEATTIEPPRATVHKPRLAKHGLIKTGSRVGRGFSIGELQAVGLTVDMARKLGLYVDERRRSVREENVEALRKLLRDLGIE